jgi:hypothetical protein
MFVVWRQAVLHKPGSFTTISSRVMPVINPPESNKSLHTIFTIGLFCSVLTFNAPETGSAFSVWIRIQDSQNNANPDPY